MGTILTKSSIGYIFDSYNQDYSQDYKLASDSAYIACVNFIHEWRDLQLKVDSKRQIFEKLLAFCWKSAERK